MITTPGKEREKGRKREAVGGRERERERDKQRDRDREMFMWIQHYFIRYNGGQPLWGDDNHRGKAVENDIQMLHK